MSPSHAHEPRLPFSTTLSDVTLLCRCRPQQRRFPISHSTVTSTGESHVQ
jgi:hypothetical protein